MATAKTNVNGRSKATMKTAGPLPHEAGGGPPFVGAIFREGFCEPSHRKASQYESRLSAANARKAPFPRLSYAREDFR